MTGNRKPWGGVVAQDQDENHRKFVRTRLRAAVTVRHPDLGDVATYTRDISDGGAYVLTDGPPLPSIGDIVEVQVQDLPGGEAPVVRMRVVRVDKQGIGLQFVHDGEG
jgi:hypothetical protein